MERRGRTYTKMRWSREDVRIQAMPKDTWEEKLGWPGFPLPGPPCENKVRTHSTGLGIAVIAEAAHLLGISFF